MNPKILDQVPWDAVMPAGPQSILIALSVLLFALSLWYIVIEIRRRGDWVPLYAFLGGGLIIVYEPLGDILVSVLYPIHGQIGWIDMFGRQIPLFIGVLYFWYMSVPALYFLRRVEQGLTKAALWRLYGMTLAIAIAIELFGVNLDAWVYYGPHPYVLFGVPLWCPLTYSAFLMTISMGLHAMVQALDRRHHWLIVLGVPLFMSGGHAACALPAAAAMFTTSDPLWIALGGAASIGLSLLLVYTASQIFCVDAAPMTTRARGLRSAHSAL
jgi:hypothetical protein